METIEQMIGRVITFIYPERKGNDLVNNIAELEESGYDDFGRYIFHCFEKYKEFVEQLHSYDKFGKQLWCESIDTFYNLLII